MIYSLNKIARAAAVVSARPEASARADMSAATEAARGPLREGSLTFARPRVTRCLARRGSSGPDAASELGI